MARLKVSKGFIERWMGQEFASWEDHKRPTTGAHPYTVLSKSPSAIIVETEEERQSLMKSADHWLDYYSYEINLPAVARAFRRVIDWLNSSLETESADERAARAAATSSFDPHE